MKTSHLINILLAVALVVLSIRLVRDNPQPTASTDADGATSATVQSKDAEEAVKQNILTRTSIRAYTDKDVDEKSVEQLLRAAMAGPTAGNKQPWRFVVIRDNATLKKISENFKSMAMAEHAPVAIVVCGDTEATFPGEGVGYWIQDASAATENLLLMAHSMGLGAVWCGIYPMSDRVKILSEMLSLPANIIPLNVIPIGYPAEDPAPKDKWTPASVHYEKW